MYLFFCLSPAADLAGNIQSMQLTSHCLYHVRKPPARTVAQYLHAVQILIQRRQFVPLSVHTQRILPRDWSLASSKLSPDSAFQCYSVRFLSKLPCADIKH